MFDRPRETEIFTKHYLNDILTYATIFSDFYKQYRGYQSLNDFPIVNKEILKSYLDKIVVRQYADCIDNRIKYTSGSTAHRS